MSDSPAEAPSDLGATPNDAPAPGLAPADLTRQRDESFRELIKALLILNGGGAVALLAFLQAVWTDSRALARPTICAIAALAIGALLAAASHLFRYEASWHWQRGEIDRWSRDRRIYLLLPSLSLALFVVGVAIVVVGAVRAL
jgi:hypothetical protein